jgi:transcriptional regulator with PAS, ATPase and Fis domain
MVAVGNFRQDLLYRLNTVEIQLPPLRDRLEDIPLLVHHFLNQYALKYHRSSIGIPEYVIRKLQKYHWPGNVRELQHAVERAVIMSDGNVLRSADFAFLLEFEEEEKIEGTTLHLDSLEKWAIQRALRKHHGNVSKAAEELGLTRGTLYRRMEKHEL